MKERLFGLFLWYLDVLSSTSRKQAVPNILQVCTRGEVCMLGYKCRKIAPGDLKVFIIGTQQQLTVAHCVER